MAEKRTVSAKDVLADIQAGMSDEQLMAKYKLSSKGLENVKDKLSAGGHITQAVRGRDSTEKQQSSPRVSLAHTAGATGRSQEVRSEGGDAFCRNCGSPVSKQAEYCLSCGVRPQQGTRYCQHCGASTQANQEICIKCGVRLGKPSQSKDVMQGLGYAVSAKPAARAGSDVGQAPRDWLVTLLLCIFLGLLGIHRFYTGHTVIGIIQLFTFGGLGIWTLIDLIMIATNRYVDAAGQPLQKN